MNEILISINKPHTDNIFIHRTKDVEWRKTPLPIGKAYCYETKNKGGLGLVIGEFTIIENSRIDLKHYQIYSEFISRGAVPVDELLDYAGHGFVWGNVFDNVIRYDTPIELDEFHKPCDNLVDGCSCKYFIANPCPHLGVLVERYGRHKEHFRIANEMYCRNVLTRPPQSWCYVAR